MHVPGGRHVRPVGQPVPASGAAPSTHCTHRPKVQYGVIPEQSEFCAHCTQVDVIVSQTVAPIMVHWALLVQPARHMKFL
jgi:hypothetical protein